MLGGVTRVCGVWRVACGANSPHISTECTCTCMYMNHSSYQAYNLHLCKAAESLGETPQILDYTSTSVGLLINKNTALHRLPSSRANQIFIAVPRETCGFGCRPLIDSSTQRWLDRGQRCVGWRHSRQGGHRN